MYSVTTIEHRRYHRTELIPVQEVDLDDGRYIVLDENFAEVRDENDAVIYTASRVFSSNSINDEIDLLLENMVALGI